MAFKRILFQVHLWVGLTAGVVFVLIGLTGSLVMLRPLFVAPPQVQAATAAIPALDKGLAAARAAVDVPSDAETDIYLPMKSGDAVRYHFRATYGSGRRVDVADVLTDPASGALLTTYRIVTPAFLRIAGDFHNRLLLPNGRVVMGAFGLGMMFLGLSGLFLWWPRRGQWKWAFGVRRKARGARFHRELHGAVGIWTLVFFLLITVTGTGMCWRLVNRDIISFVTEGHVAPPQQNPRAPVVSVPPGAARIGPDAALAAAWAGGLEKAPFLVNLPADIDKAYGVTVGLMYDLPVYVDPYRAAVVPSQVPVPTRVDLIQQSMGRLHEGVGTGTLYWIMEFVTGLLPLVFFVTGIGMWWRKRQGRLAMHQPLPVEID